jgi:hypothetical protein
LDILDEQSDDLELVQFLDHGSTTSRFRIDRVDDRTSGPDGKRLSSCAPERNTDEGRQVERRVILSLFEIDTTPLDRQGPHP